jgi:hypothetical protein
MERRIKPTRRTPKMEEFEIEFEEEKRLRFEEQEKAIHEAAEKEENDYKQTKEGKKWWKEREEERSEARTMELASMYYGGMYGDKEKEKEKFKIKRERIIGYDLCFGVSQEGNFTVSLSPPFSSFIYTHSFLSVSGFDFGFNSFNPPLSMSIPSSYSFPPFPSLELKPVAFEDTLTSIPPKTPTSHFNGLTPGGLATPGRIPPVSPLSRKGPPLSPTSRSLPPTSPSRNSNSIGETHFGSTPLRNSPSGNLSKAQAHQMPSLSRLSGSSSRLLAGPNITRTASFGPSRLGVSSLQSQSTILSTPGFGDRKSVV